MWNRQKSLGVVIAAAGVFLARIDSFSPIEKTLLFSLTALGIMIALAGIAVYAAGMPRELKKIRVCPGCFARNEATAEVCRRCKKPLEKNKQETL